MLPWLRNLFAGNSSDTIAARFHHDAAYLIFPCYALVEPHEFKAWAAEPRPAELFATNAAQLLKLSTARLHIDRFGWHQGKLDDGRDYVAIQYPEPGASPGPLFSLWVGQLDNPAGVNSCFLMSTSSVAGQTALRQFTQAGHYDRGPGPESRLDALLEALKTLDAWPVLGCEVGAKDTHTEVDRVLLQKMGLNPDD